MHTPLREITFHVHGPHRAIRHMPPLLSSGHVHIKQCRPLCSAESITVGGAQEVALRSGAAVRQGHLATIREFVAANSITDVVLNFNASGSHLTRIAHALQPEAPAGGTVPEAVVVKCRTAVVLDIFRKHASTAEARLQVKLAGACSLCGRCGTTNSHSNLEQPPLPCDHVATPMTTTTQIVIAPA